MITAVRNLLGLYEMSREDILSLLDKCEEHFQAGVNAPREPFSSLLQSYSAAVLCWWSVGPDGKRAASVTAEDDYVSTSFCSAVKSLGAFCVAANPDPVESLSDIVRSIKAMLSTSEPPLAVIVARHTNSGIPRELSSLPVVHESRIAVINGGDGEHENPTEALIYIYLIRSKHPDMKGIRVLIVGDLSSDPLVHSLVFGLCRLRADVHVVVPVGVDTIALPSDIKVTIHHDFSTVTQKPDVVLSVPVRLDVLERSHIASREEYLSLFSISNLRIDQSYQGMLMIPCNSKEPETTIDHFPGSNRKAFRSQIQEPTQAHVSAARMAALRYCFYA